MDEAQFKKTASIVDHDRMHLRKSLNELEISYNGAHSRRKQVKTKTRCQIDKQVTQYEDSRLPNVDHLVDISNNNNMRISQRLSFDEPTIPRSDQHCTDNYYGQARVNPSTNPSTKMNERFHGSFMSPSEQVRWHKNKCHRGDNKTLARANPIKFLANRDNKLRLFEENCTKRGTNKRLNLKLLLSSSRLALSLSLSLVLTSLFLLLITTSFNSPTRKLGVHGYQLTNNLIASNLPPKFVTTNSQQMGGSNSEIVVRVKEGPGSIGKLIYTLRGEDPDDDPITFGVLGSMASDLLRIENVPKNQANVYLKKELDRETTESYQVVITLTDGKLGRGNWITKSMLIIVSRSEAD